MKLIYSSFLLIIGGLFFMNNSGGRAATEGQGNTGAPGDNKKVCKVCHNSDDIEVVMDISLWDRNDRQVTVYVPNEIYRVLVEITPVKGTPKAFGFQMVCLDAEPGEDGFDIKNWIDDQNNNYKISEADNGRLYVEHDNPSDTNQFMVTWKAPERGTGTVSFYSAGNGVNLNGSLTGDGATRDSLSISEDMNTSVSLLNEEDIKIYPTYVMDVLHIVLPEGSSGRASIFSTNGQVVKQRNIMNAQSLDVTSLTPGIYSVWLQLSNRPSPIVKKLIKY